MKNITIKQDIALEAIKFFIAEKGLSPTIKELQGILGYKSATSIEGFLVALEKKGYIKRTSNIARSIAVLQV